LPPPLAPPPLPLLFSCCGGPLLDRLLLLPFGCNVLRDARNMRYSGVKSKKQLQHTQRDSAPHPPLGPCGLYAVCARQYACWQRPQ
jgi:hypothetical protein